MRKTYHQTESYTATKNTVIDTLSIFEFTDHTIKDAWINIGGYQAWSGAFEIAPGKKQPKLKYSVLPILTEILSFPNTNYKESKRYVLGHFVSYLRWNDTYLVFASCGNVNNTLPPVQFVFDRQNNDVKIELCDKGKSWEKDELACEVEIFLAESYFDAKEKLGEIFTGKNFEQIEFLRVNDKSMVLGWESWYNHYTDINEELILEDLDALVSENILQNLKEDQPIIFQIDDGWEKHVGDWTINEDKFPSGLSSIVDSIESKGFVPGLWVAPFLVFESNPIAIEHPDWILRNNNNKKVTAGLNFAWEASRYYVLDLSKDEVLEYLDSIMETVINEWGFRYIKLDFLFSGMLYGNYANSGASYEWYKKAIKLLTRRKKTKDGKDVAYLGCGLPMELSFNEFPISRIGCDTCEHWKETYLTRVNFVGGANTYYNLKDTIGRAMWDNTIFVNDPDVLFIREDNCTLTKEQKLLIAKINIMLSGQIMYSDDPKKCTEADMELTKEITELYNKYKDEEFSVKNITENNIEYRSKSGKYTGELKLMNN